MARRVKKRRPLRSRPESGRRWVIYVRQSKKKKNAKGEITTLSIEDQEGRSRTAIAQLDPSPKSVHVVVDHGKPGGRGKQRPGRDEVLTLVEGGQIDAVMALKASRIGRSLEESENFWNRCCDAGAFVAAADCHDLSSPAIRGVYFGMAEQENADRSDYSLAIIDHRRSQGKPPVKGGVAYGLRWRGDRLVRVAKEFAVVEKCFRLFDGGMSMGEIARQLTVEQAPRRNPGHIQWVSAAVSRILRCTWYDGRIPDGDGFYETGQRFIDRDLFARVNARLQTIEDTGQRLHRALSGLLYCGKCGGWSPMSLCYSRHKRKDGSIQQNDRYRCIHAVRERSFCQGQSIKAKDVEEFLLSQIQLVLADDELAEARFERLRKNVAGGSRPELGEIDARIEEVKGGQRALFDRRKNGELIPDFIYDEEMAAFETEAKRLTAKRTKLLAGARLGSAALKRLRSEVEQGGPLASERWFDLPQARRNEFLRLLFPHGVAVTPASDRQVSASARLRVRSAEEAEEAEARRLGEGTQAAGSKGPASGEVRAG